MKEYLRLCRKSPAYPLPTVRLTNNIKCIFGFPFRGSCHAVTDEVYEMNDCKCA